MNRFNHKAWISVFVGSLLGVPAADAEKLYWASDSTPDGIRRSNTDGSQLEDVALALDNPWAFALDESTGKMYWSEGGSDTHTIRRANLDGSAMEDLVVAGEGAAKGIAIDAAAGKMYWTASGSTLSEPDRDHKVRRANIDGSNPEDIWTHVPDTDGLPLGIAVDGVNGKVYWGVYGKAIWHANLDGSGAEILVPDINHQFAAAIVVHGTAGKVYWAQNGGPVLPSTIKRMNLDGTNIELILTLTPPSNVPQGFALDPMADAMYWTSVNGFIRRATLAGTQVTTVASGLGTLRHLAVDRTCCRPYGDIFPAGFHVDGQCLVDVDDLWCAIQGFENGSCAGADLAPCGGNGLIDVDDVLAAVEAFTGTAGCAASCP